MSLEAVSAEHVFLHSHRAVSLLSQMPSGQSSSSSCSMLSQQSLSLSLHTNSVGWYLLLLDAVWAEPIFYSYSASEYFSYRASSPLLASDHGLLPQADSSDLLAPSVVSAVLMCANHAAFLPLASVPRGGKFGSLFQSSLMGTWGGHSSLSE